MSRGVLCSHALDITAWVKSEENMTIRKLAVRALAALLLCMPGARAEQMGTTEQLILDCLQQQPTSEDPDLGFGYCIGYIAATMDMHALMADPHIAGGAQRFCLPGNGISNKQAIKVFLEWADDHPEALQQGALLSVVIALNHAFPCH
jgi:hypothetical protein